MSREKGTIVLDARSKEMYDLMHVKGAINLSFPNIDIESLKKTLPDKNARILIYCNNNFKTDSPGTIAGGGIPVEGADRVAEHLDLHRTLQLRLQERLRTRAAGRPGEVEARRSSPTSRGNSVR